MHAQHQWKSSHHIQVIHIIQIYFRHDMDFTEKTPSSTETRFAHENYKH